MSIRTAIIFLLASAACSSDPESPGAPASTRTTTGPASFSEDVVPILTGSCALTACHAAKQSNLGIHLTFDAAQIYAELQKESPTHPGLRFVVPGKPEESFLMAKIDGTQGKLARCTTGCGKEMPPEDLLPQAKRDVVRAWIAGGAKND